MRIRWRGFELPTRVYCNQDTLTDNYGEFYAEPFERGYGTTIGNSLRRVLLSSIDGVAPVWVKIEGCSHEYASMEGVVEDVTYILLNFKDLVLKSDIEEEQVLTLSKRGPGDVTAADIQTNENVEVVNPELHLATLTGDVDFNVEIGLKRGRGYVPAEDHTDIDKSMIGLITLDSRFSPVTRVNYKVSDTRIGQRTNYDRLDLQLWTNGSIEPSEVLNEASLILRKHLMPFVKPFTPGEVVKVEDRAQEMIETETRECDEEAMKKLDRTIDSLNLSVRTENCLNAEGIKTLGELVQKKESDLLKIRSFGKTSLKELQNKLEELGLSFGMTCEEEL